MNNVSLLFFALLALSSCHGLKEKGKETINSAGQAVGQGTTQFVEGVKEGADKTYLSTLVLSDTLRSLGLSVGKFYIEQQADSSYMLYIYFIFNRDLDHNISVKVFDQKGLEYGRRARNIYGHAGDAHYEEVGFDKRTVI